MSVVVYWLDAQKSAQYQEFAQYELLAALAKAQHLRKEGLGHVCISSELDDNAGLMGVSDERPSDYNWSKQHRGGASFETMSNVLKSSVVRQLKNPSKEGFLSNQVEALCTAGSSQFEK